MRTAAAAASNFDRSGKVYRHRETALDDVIGDYAFTNGFAYASVDRDGIGGTRVGYALTMQFETVAQEQVTRIRRARRRCARMSSGSPRVAGSPA